jgi:glutamate 5-kinase
MNNDAQHIGIVDKITPQIEAMAGDAGSGLSKGGMITKVMAARVATDAGCAMAIALGTGLNPLGQLENGAPATWFSAQTDPQAARKRWISAMKPRGTVMIDAGAAGALGRGKSLLPAGVTQINGSFGRGDLVAIVGPEGAQLGQGLVRYTSAEALQIMGRKSAEIADLLGYEGRAALVHRDDMVL